MVSRFAVPTNTKILPPDIVVQSSSPDAFIDVWIIIYIPSPASAPVAATLTVTVVTAESDIVVAAPSRMVFSATAAHSSTTAEVLLTAALTEQVIAANREGVVVGLSGGLDSSVTAVLCKRALAKNMLAVLMPCHSSQIDIEYAELIARKFDIPLKTIALDAVFDLLVETLPSEGLEPATQRLAEANLKPRLRMLTLYYLANRLNYLVVGTGNRSELAVGYSTKYGDGGVDILPLGNLVKSQVRELAKHLGIPQEIVQRPPSAGLWAGQTDEEEMGITYEELDRYLTTGKASEQVRKRVDGLAQASAHKRRTPLIPPQDLGSQ